MPESAEVTDPGSQEASRRAAVEEVLVASGAVRADERVTSLTQLAGGWSRHSYAVQTTDRRLVVRVKPQGGLLDTDLGSEYRLYLDLAQSAISIPAVHGIDESDDTAFGGPFFVMDYVEGEAMNAFRGRDREALRRDWDGERGVASDMVAHLARIHDLQLVRSADDLPRLDFLAVVDRWQEVHERTRGIRDPVVEEGFAWLRARVPADEQVGLVHGDYRIGNVLVADGRVRAVLDWELAYVGDVRFDLGYFALDYTAGRHLQPVTDLIGAVADRSWFLAEYERHAGRPVDLEVVRTFSVLGIMMLLGTVYTGISRYIAGSTDDIRMAWNRFALPGLRLELATLMQW
ncbi:MAG: phosphotransferase family protein [Conexibacter sp.]|nr:phosphotransferase family protein [Conexibacter sp.]